MTDFSSKNDSFVVFNNALPHYAALLKYPNYTIFGKNNSDYKDAIHVDDDKYSLSHYHVNVATIRFLGTRSNNGSASNFL